MSRDGGMSATTAPMTSFNTLICGNHGASVAGASIRNRGSCRREARNDYVTCRSECRENNEDVDERLACYKDCRTTRDDALNACN